MPCSSCASNNRSEFDAGGSGGFGVEHVFDSVQPGGGGAGGAIVMAIVGLIKTQMAKADGNGSRSKLV